jgi:hypothetical protein
MMWREKERDGMRKIKRELGLLTSKNQLLSKCFSFKGSSFELMAITCILISGGKLDCPEKLNPFLS